MEKTFYYTVALTDIRPYMPDIPVLFPASSFVRARKDGTYSLRVPHPPEHVRELAADCGGFVATFRWGEYRYSVEQYVEWLTAWRPSWAAMLDYCCEREVAGSLGIARAPATNDRDGMPDMAALSLQFLVLGADGPGLAGLGL